MPPTLVQSGFSARPARSVVAAGETGGRSGQPSGRHALKRRGVRRQGKRLHAQDRRLLRATDPRDAGVSDKALGAASSYPADARASTPACAVKPGPFNPEPAKLWLFQGTFAARSRSNRIPATFGWRLQIASHSRDEGSVRAVAGVLDRFLWVFLGVCDLERAVPFATGHIPRGL